MESLSEFQSALAAGIPDQLPPPAKIDLSVSHAPVRKDILTPEEKAKAVANALRYFPAVHHEVLAKEFYQELKDYGRIYMYRFRPAYKMYARPIEQYPAKTRQAAAIMLMIQNNLDPAVAQHPHELITYGGNGAVFQNWAQYLLTMQYLATMDENQTLHMYSGHPMGLFPSHPDAPRVVVTNGMMIPNYSKPDDWERFNALGVTQYGQMTAGSYMYIGPQGIVHGTTITLLNAARKIRQDESSDVPLLFVTSGLGGMSGAQPKAAKIAGYISVTAEVNPLAAYKRHEQGWVDEIIDDLPEVVDRILLARKNKEVVSIAYLGNIVDLWEYLLKREITVEVGSDQTSLHNPWSGGYYPSGFAFAEAQKMMAAQPDKFKEAVKQSLVRHATAVIAHSKRGTYFFDYGNAFLLEASRAGAPLMKSDGDFIFPSYVQDIMGPLCFDYGFGPFRWVCTSGKESDLEQTDEIAASVLEKQYNQAKEWNRSQIEDNLHWIRSAKENKLVVGSKARILYADSAGRIAIAKAFNKAISDGKIGPVVLGRDHHDVSGTDSPYRETSNIRDGSRFTADMAIQNVIGDSFRGATWVSIHNGGGVGWGEVINGGFGMLLDGSEDTERRLSAMLHYDVNNGIARRAWAGNVGAKLAIQDEMERTPGLKITQSHMVDPNSLEKWID